MSRDRWDGTRGREAAKNYARPYERDAARAAPLFFLARGPAGSRPAGLVAGRARPARRPTNTAKSATALRSTMPDRIMKVNAYTTLDLLDGRAEGHDFEEEAFATLNVTSPRRDPDHVSLQLELDSTELEHLPAHADSVTLSAEQARALAADLEEHAGRVEAARE